MSFKEVFKGHICDKCGESLHDCPSEMACQANQLRSRVAELESERDALKCCGNCKHGDITGCRKICDDCHGYAKVNNSDKAKYLKHWTRQESE